MQTFNMFAFRIRESQRFNGSSDDAQTGFEHLELDAVRPHFHNKNCIACAHILAHNART